MRKVACVAVVVCSVVHEKRFLDLIFFIWFALLQNSLPALSKGFRMALQLILAESLLTELNYTAISRSAG